MKHTHLRVILLCLAVSLSLGACSVTSEQNGVMKAETRKGGFMGLSTNEAVEVTTPAAFQNKKSIVIGGFKVGFNESKRMARKAGGGLMGGGFGGKATGLVKLEGVDAKTKQAITNQVYADFIATLKANGYTVVDRSQFTNSEAYKGTKTYAFPYLDDNSGILSEYGAATYYSPAAIGAQQPIFMGEIAGVTGGFGFANPMNAAAQFGEKTGIAVLNVTYFVDFAGADGHGNSWTSTASLKVGQMMSVDQGILGITSGQAGTFSKAIGSLRLGQPIVSDKAFATIEEASSGMDKGLETATNVATALLGGGTNQTRKFVYRSTPEKYTHAASDALKKANKAFVGKMTALR